MNFENRADSNKWAPLYIFYYPFVLLGDLLASFTTYKIKTILFVFLSVSMVSMSNVYIYRYLNKVIEHSRSVSLLLTIFFALFSTCLVLSFTRESFTLSLFLLTYSLYYYSWCIKEGRKPPLINSILITLSLGGVTVTNFSKGILPIFFTSQSFKSKIKQAIILTVSFIGILCFVHLASLIYLDKNLFHSMISHKDSFTLDSNNTAYFNQIIDHFFGAPISFPALKDFFYYNVQGHWGLYDMKMPQELNYQYWWQYAFIIFLALFIAISLIRNNKNRFVQLIFFPLLFAFKFSDYKLFITASIAFISFSLIASSIYIINDLCDLEMDKLHPTKRERPLASGKIKKNEAFVLISVMTI